VLAPSVPSAEIHAVVHRAAQALQRGLTEGVTLAEILDVMILATAPAAPEDPPPPPWADLLALSLDAFAETGAALGIRFRALGISTWWTGPEAQARRVAAERRLSMREIWRRDRLQQEARAAGLDGATATIADLVEALGGEVRGWRPAAA
jgi:hypothetical protein